MTTSIDEAAIRALRDKARSTPYSTVRLVAQEADALCTLALSAIASRQAVVKPLEWDGDFAHTDLGLYYYVNHATGQPGWVILERHQGSSTTNQGWPTIEAARAAAQADYTQRINSALAAPVRDETEIRAATLEEALKLALIRLVEFEPPDSRAVSDEFVAMAAIAEGGDLATPECIEIVRRALSQGETR